MNRQNIYRALLKISPQSKKQTNITDSALLSAIRSQHALGATLCVFDPEKGESVYTYGEARTGVPCTKDTVYRIASVSKHISTYGVLKLANKGMLDLDKDIGDYLGYAVRSPFFPEEKITLRQILSHTSGIIDSETYLKTLGASPRALKELLKNKNTYRESRRFCYSNLAFGIVGSVTEAATGLDFDDCMKKEVFEPLGIGSATYYPQRAGEKLADARRILPRSKTPNFDAAARLKAALPSGQPNPEYHYLMSHGSLCITAPDLAKLGNIMCRDREIGPMMRKEVTPFGASAPMLSMGLGTFIVHDDTVCKKLLYGHQGLAYGAVHGLFYDVQTSRVMAYLTQGISEARNGVLSDSNKAVMRVVFGDEAWK